MVIADIIIDYDLIVAEMYEKYSTLKVFDRRFYTLVKVLGHQATIELQALNQLRLSGRSKKQA